MRQHLAGESNKKPCDDYRSHPLSTKEAIPCIENANTKIKAESAPSHATKRDVVVNDEAISSCLVHLHDRPPARRETAPPANEQMAERRDC